MRVVSRLKFLLKDKSTNSRLFAERIEIDATKKEQSFVCMSSRKWPFVLEEL